MDNTPLTKISDAGFEASRHQGDGPIRAPLPTGQSFGFQQATQAGREGFHFGFRLARMMVPKLSLAGLKVEGKTGSVYPTSVKRDVKTVISTGSGMSTSEISYEDESSGIQFINKNSVFNNVMTNKKTGKLSDRILRGSEDTNYFKTKSATLTDKSKNGRIPLLKSAYEEAYKIQGDSVLGPGLPLNANDFISPIPFQEKYTTGVNYHQLGVESTNVRDMQEIVNVIKKANDENGMPKLDNPTRYADKAYELQRDAHFILQRQVPSDALDTHIQNFEGNKGTDDKTLKDIVAVAPIKALPVSQNSIAAVYRGVASIAEPNLDRGNGLNQAKINRTLKQNSVEIVKTLVNEVTTEADGILPKSDNIEAISTNGRRIEIEKGKPSYKINDQGISGSTVDLKHDEVTEKSNKVTNVKSGNELRFFMRHLSEPRMRADAQSYRYIVFEWENLMKMNDDGSGIVASNQFNRIASMNAAFLTSSLNMLRHYVVVIVCHDEKRRQRYYAEVCQSNTEVRDFVQKFDNAWSMDSLSQVADNLFDSVFPSEGFRSDEKAIYDQVFNILPSTEFNPYTLDQFNQIYINNNAFERDEALRNGTIAGLKHGLGKALVLDDQGSVKFDIRQANMNDLEKFLQNLPRLNTRPSADSTIDGKPAGDVNGKVLPFNLSGLWFDSGNRRLSRKSNNKANLLSVPRLEKENTTLAQRLENVEVALDTRNIVPIINPIVLQAMLYLKFLISDIEYSSLKDPNQDGKVATINAAMEDIFRSKGNLFIAWQFGNILSNLFTIDNLPTISGGGEGDRRRKVIAYRVAAQALLNATVFAHSLGRFESVYVFARDVMLKLYTMAVVDAKSMGMGIMPGSTPVRVMQALYTATVFHVAGGRRMGNSDFGLTINKAGEFFNKSRRNVRLLIKDNEVADPKDLKDVTGSNLDAFEIIGDTEKVPKDKINFVDIKADNIDLGKLRNMVVRSFHYWAMCLLDDDYLRTNLLGLQAGPHGGELDKMERSIRNYLGTTQNLYEEQIRRDGRYILPNIMSGEDKSKRQTLTDRMNKQLGEGRMITQDGQVVFSDAVGRIEVPRETLTTFDETTQNQLLQGTKVYEEGMVRAL